MNNLPQFPHCDARVLHAPGECGFCDKHPDWQELRRIWMVAFTGHEPVTYEHSGTQVPCPADFNRPAGADNDHRRWAGNVATSQDPVNETASSLIYYNKAYSTNIVPRSSTKRRKHWWELLKKNNNSD